jgi:hypothetical protein
MSSKRVKEYLEEYIIESSPSWIKNKSTEELEGYEKEHPETHKATMDYIRREIQIRKNKGKFNKIPFNIKSSYRSDNEVRSFYRNNNKVRSYIQDIGGLSIDKLAKSYNLEDVPSENLSKKPYSEGTIIVVVKENFKKTDYNRFLPKWRQGSERYYSRQYKKGEILNVMNGAKLERQDDMFKNRKQILDDAGRLKFYYVSETNAESKIMIEKILKGNVSSNYAQGNDPLKGKENFRKEDLKNQYATKLIEKKAIDRGEKILKELKNKIDDFKNKNKKVINDIVEIIKNDDNFSFSDLKRKINDELDKNKDKFINYDTYSDSYKNNPVYIEKRINEKIKEIKEHPYSWPVKELNDYCDQVENMEKE